jgi:hypothetical protein
LLVAQAADVKRYERELAIWDDERETLGTELALAQDPSGFNRHVDGLDLVLHKEEVAFLSIAGVALVEPKQLPGHWVGSYSGVSLRVMKGVTVHTGGSRGTYEPGESAPRITAMGTATITNQRVAFQSSLQARKFSFSKLLGYQHDASEPLTYFQVSNRQKVSGIGYDKGSARKWRLRLSLALAVYNDETANFADHLKAELVQHETDKPLRHL